MIDLKQRPKVGEELRLRLVHDRTLLSEVGLMVEQITAGEHPLKSVRICQRMDSSRLNEEARQGLLSLVHDRSMCGEGERDELTYRRLVKQLQSLTSHAWSFVAVAGKLTGELEVELTKLGEGIPRHLQEDIRHYQTVAEWRVTAVYTPPKIAEVIYKDLATPIL